MIDIQTLSSNAHQLARDLGIDKFDIYGSSVDSSSVKVDHGEPEQVKAANRSSVTVRVWNGDGRMGVTSTTDCDRAGLELALRTAQEASDFGAIDHVPDFSPEATVPIADLKDDLAPHAPINELLETLVDAERRFLEAHEAIAAVPYNNLAQQDTEQFYLNSDGAARREARSYASMYLVSKTEQPNRKPRSAGAYRVARDLARLDVEGCLREATEKTLAHLDYQKIQSGKYAVVLSPEAFLSLLGAFSNLYNAQSILDKQSLSTPDSLGSAIASPLLSVYDDARHPENVAATYFDGEGTPTRRVPLIEKGILTSFLHSAGTAKRLGAEPTGHASIGAKVSISPEFYHVVAAQPADAASHAGSYDVATADNVILVDELHALHAGVNSLEGSFSLPFDGWLLKGGDRISIESATVAGDFRDLLQAIVHVETAAEITPSGICPRVWVGELAVTGEG
ncbi:MAG: TldD/PmbA family protein [Cyanophyceae cyanobacterium]